MHNFFQLRITRILRIIFHNGFRRILRILFNAYYAAEIRLIREIRSF